MMYDQRTDGLDKQVVIYQGNEITIWHFHEDLNLGERYVVKLVNIGDKWVITGVQRPLRFTEPIVGTTFRFPGSTGELKGLQLPDNIKLGESR